MNNHDLLLSPSSPQSVQLVREFLEEHSSGVLSTADRSGNPHAAVIYYTVDDKFCLTFATKTETQKCKNMEQNPVAAFVVYEEASQTTIQIAGRVEKVTDGDVQQKAINTIYRLSETNSHVELPPIEKLFAGDYVTFRLVPQVIRMGIFLRPDSESNEDVYEIITFNERTPAP